MKRIIKFLLQAIIVIFSFFALGNFLVQMCFSIINIGNLLGSAICVAIILVTIFFKRLVSLCKYLWQHKKGKIFLSIFSAVFIICAVCFTATLGSIIYEAGGNADNQQTLIVLGCQVKGDTPSLMLSRRVNAAYDYMLENPDSVAVLSGGKGNGENLSEAQCMYNLLTEKGVEPERLYIEDKSVSTATNIENSKKIILENKLSEDIAVVSSDYHLKRAKMICKKQGLNVKTISAKSSFFEKPTFYLREVLGVAKEFLF